MACEGTAVVGRTGFRDLARLRRPRPGSPVRVGAEPGAPPPIRGGRSAAHARQGLRAPGPAGADLSKPSEARTPVLSGPHLIAAHHCRSSADRGPMVGTPAALT